MCSDSRRNKYYYELICNAYKLKLRTYLNAKWVEKSKDVYKTQTVLYSGRETVSTSLLEIIII